MIALTVFFHYHPADKLKNLSPFPATDGRTANDKLKINKILFM